MSEFKAFSNPLITKERMLFHLREHQKQDNFLRGTYGELEFTKGCAVGCTINSINRELNLKLRVNEHEYLEEYSIAPEWLARLEDRIFENVSLERSKIWPIEFIEAINEGADLNKIKAPFLVFVLESVLEYVQDEKFTHQKKVILDCIELWKRADFGSGDWERKNIEAIRNAIAACYAADAADAAYTAAAVDAVYADADAAVYAAADAAADAYATATAAVYAVYVAYAAAATDADAVKIKKYELFADKVLELMRKCR